MIKFERKSNPRLTPVKNEQNRFEQILRTAKEMHRKSNTDATSCRPGQIVEAEKPV